MTSYCAQCLLKFEQENAGQEFCKTECRIAYGKELATERTYKRSVLRRPGQSSGLPQVHGWTIPLQNSDHSQDNR
jgi:hypothetical protein